MTCFGVRRRERRVHRVAVVFCKIALIVLATLRRDHRLADLAGGNDVSASTIHRWTGEVIRLLAARAPLTAWTAP